MISIEEFKEAFIKKHGKTQLENLEKDYNKVYDGEAHTKAAREVLFCTFVNGALNTMNPESHFNKDYKEDTNEYILPNNGKETNQHNRGVS